MPRCHISLGGNTGAVAETFDQALQRLRSVPGCRVVAVSGNFETAPVGEFAGAPFLNAAAEIETSLPALALLDVLQALEQALGRVRTVRWGPRTIDLDLLYYGDEIIASPRLMVPHPAAWYRRFVLDPLVEIAPDRIHPIKRVSMRSLRERLLARPLPVALAGGAPVDRANLLALLAPRFAGVSFFAGDGPPPGVDSAALIFWLGSADRTGGCSASFCGPTRESPWIDATACAEPPHVFIGQVLQAALG